MGQTFTLTTWPQPLPLQSGNGHRLRQLLETQRGHFLDLIELNFIQHRHKNIHTQYIVAVLQRIIQFKMKHSNQEAVLVKKQVFHE